MGLHRLLRQEQLLGDLAVGELIGNQLGDLELAADRLTLPHPEVTSRRFVLAPLLELDPDLTLPDGTRLAEALASLGPGQRARRASQLG